MSETKHRWPRFPLWSVFLLTAVVAVLVAACTGAFGDTVQIGSWTIIVASSILVFFKLVDWIACKLLGRKLKW